MNSSFLLNLILLLCIYTTSIYSYSVTVTYDSNQCFILTSDSSSTVSGSFEVISGDPNQLIISVIGPPPLKYVHFESKYKAGLEEEKDLSEGEFAFISNKAGDYQMCLASNDDVGSDGLPAVIAFNFRTLSSGEQDYQYKGLDKELIELRQGLDSLKDHQSYMNQREDVHTSTLESINTKVTFWTVIEAIMLVGMALWQVTYISNFFETKRKI